MGNGKSTMFSSAFINQGKDSNCRACLLMTTGVLDLFKMASSEDAGRRCNFAFPVLAVTNRKNRCADFEMTGLGCPKSG